MRLQNQQVLSMKLLGFLPAGEVADILGVHVSQVYRAAQRGKLRAARIGRAWYVTFDSLLAYLRASEPPAPSALIAQVERLQREAKRSSTSASQERGA